MEYINKVEIKGIVGRTSVWQVGAVTIGRFSVMTEETYVQGNESVVKSTWFNCIAYNLERYPAKGEVVHVWGCFRAHTYTGVDGTARLIYEIKVKEIELSAK